jgi:hypothetical protein
MRPRVFAWARTTLGSDGELPAASRWALRYPRAATTRTRPRAFVGRQACAKVVADPVELDALTGVAAERVGAHWLATEDTPSATRTGSFWDTLSSVLQHYPIPRSTLPRRAAIMILGPSGGPDETACPLA